jgi:hypothetical protein
LWSAGARADALRLMRSCCQTYDPDFHLYGTDADRLGICHGAAGVLLIADAFARHAGLAGAAGLRDLLWTYLIDRLDDLRQLDDSLLTGSAGVLAALLTVGGADRKWLRCLGLR